MSCYVNLSGRIVCGIFQKYLIKELSFHRASQWNECSRESPLGNAALQ